MDNIASSTVTGSSQSQLTTSLITPATRKRVLKVKQHCAVSVTCVLSRETTRLHIVDLELVLELINPGLSYTEQDYEKTISVRMRNLQLSLPCQKVLRTAAGLFHFPLFSPHNI